MDKKHKFYCDMDGVLVDFNKGYLKLTGIDISGQYLNDKGFWKPIDEGGVDFWYNLPWMPDGKTLWNYIEKYKPDILSAPSREDSSRVGKNKWVNKHLPGVHLILRSVEHKKEFASPTSVLIDDRKENIDSWVEAGGIGILHTNTPDTIKQLKKLGL